MTVIELYYLLDRLIDQGHADVDVVMNEDEWSEGHHGQVAIAAPLLAESDPYDITDELTPRVLLINLYAAKENF